MKTETNHFYAKPISHGIYLVTYTSPKTGKQWSKRITDMGHIDNLKSANPVRKKLDYLKFIIKN